MAAPQRPNFIDLHSHAHVPIPRPIKSPRLHVAGDVPPELSPLDAFALQSRLLARQLEESARADNRVSRLPPLTTESPLVMQGRSEYFRSMSYDTALEGDRKPGDPSEPKSATSQPMTPVGFGTRMPEVEEPHVRPQSMHPRMSRVPPTPEENVPPIPDFASGRRPLSSRRDSIKPGFQFDDDDTGSVFGARRARSPSLMDEEVPEVPEEDDAEMQLRPSLSNTAPPPPGQLSPGGHSNLIPFTQSPERTMVRNNSFDSNASGLAPPRALFPQRSSSILSSPLDEVVDEDSQSLRGVPPPRKLSSSSAMVSPAFGSFQRSPSICSDMSVPLPRPSFNFSRPMSRVGTPGPESPARQASSDSQTSYSQSSFNPAEDAVTPVSVNSEMFPDTAVMGEDGRGAPSYIYSKFSLPRGKMLERGIMYDANGQPVESPLGGQAPPSPPTRPSSSGNLMPRPSLERSKLSMEVLATASQPSPDPSRPSTDGGRSSEDGPRGRSMTAQSHDGILSQRGKTPSSMKTAGTDGTSDSASTIKPPRTARSIATTSEMSAEEHVEKAIALHEKGALNESTYHLRHAARQGHPTGMLLYALACRHGWGMRANPREGAEWLRKAADCASLEIADDEALIKEGKMVDSVERKTRKAQFALSIYELGVSYMNGWGIEQDKPLALRCFEIAGSWGDVDALAEAGFCYAEGTGCKKDMKKSAKFYREAEAKGMSMVGNSWIHKAKYNEDKDDKKRSKSRPRMFGKHAA